MLIGNAEWERCSQLVSMDEVSGQYKVHVYFEHIMAKRIVIAAYDQIKVHAYHEHGILKAETGVMWPAHCIQFAFPI